MQRLLGVGKSCLVSGNLLHVVTNVLSVSNSLLPVISLIVAQYY